MRRPFSLKFTLLLGLALSACLAASCSENGATSSCPPLPQYQTSSLADGSVPDADVDAAGAAAIEAQVARAVDAGCYTAPTFFPSEGGMGGAGPSAGGAGGSSVGAAGTQH
ncbi:MAG: hypothetical protein ABI548_12165 [Polyangiaceae bacterium]